MRAIPAGQEFLKAVCADLTSLAEASIRRFRRRETSRSDSATGFGRDLRRVVTDIIQLCAVLLAIGAVAVSGAMAWALQSIPRVARPIGETPAPSLLIEAADGKPLGRVGPLKSPETSRENFAAPLVRAVISIEDRRFYQHWGADPIGILRALRRNLAAGTIMEGGSTITQQLVKTRILRPARTPLDKLREALIAVWLETKLSKDEILTRYLNSVYLGEGAYGMTAAARLYFDKRPSDLTLPEAALLAGLIKCPSRCNPLTNPEESHNRTDAVLEAMVRNGVIDTKMAEQAESHPAVLHLSEEATHAGSWFADWVAQEARRVAGSYSANVKVRTTLVPQLQQLGPADGR